MALNDVLSALDYSTSAFWLTDPPTDPAVGHFFRAVRKIGGAGAYVFQASPAGHAILPHQPAVVAAQADTTADAHRLHKSIWNLGRVPFLLVVLPGQVRVYAGFRYSSSDPEDGLITTATLDDLDDIIRRFASPVIDSGRVWQAERSALQMDKSVDTHLLRNLAELGATLRTQFGLAPSTAHALIGKYIYISYLRQRRILSDDWLTNHKVDPERVFSRNAKSSELRRLVQAIEDKFAGNIFPFPASGAGLTDSVVRFTAGVFAGDEAGSGQLALDFAAYDFSVIPVELLSSIYEQFLHAEGRAKSQGAFYTPEPIAEYVIAEVDAIRSLERGTRVLDPACGSGVFLVHAYRRLIELTARDRQRRLRPAELRELLEQHIFGVERSDEACYVAQFSLLLTLLSYLEPPELHRNPTFRFPQLNNRNIFHADFFDPGSDFRQEARQFDWVIGNPPWGELSPAERRRNDRYVAKWIDAHAAEAPVARYRLSEAFLWAVREFVAEGGVVGLLVHSTSLINAQSRPFRRAFFGTNRVYRVTDFSNLAYRLFRRRADAPAASIVYAPGSPEGNILHYGPLVANQVVLKSAESGGAWALTIHEDEIQAISAEEARDGEGRLWHAALWGAERDRRTLQRVQAAFPRTLGDLVRERGWAFALGLQLREANADEPVDLLPDLVDQLVLDHKAAARGGAVRLEVPETYLEPIGQHVYVRSGRTSGVATISAPHLWITPGFTAYSDRAFVLQHPMIGISAAPRFSNELRALSLYLTSSIGRYLAFFSSTSWGIDRTRLNKGDAARIPAPVLRSRDVHYLGDLHRELSGGGEQLDKEVLSIVDKAIAKTLGLPEMTAYVASDFVAFKLGLVKGKATGLAFSTPSSQALHAYGTVLRDMLDAYGGVRHSVHILLSRDMGVCRVRLTEKDGPHEVHVEVDRTRTHSIWDSLRESRTQWIYVQRSLRIFGEREVVLVKAARLIDWSRSAATQDAGDFIAEVLSQPVLAAQ